MLLYYYMEFCAKPINMIKPLLVKDFNFGMSLRLSVFRSVFHNMDNLGEYFKIGKIRKEKRW